MNANELADCIREKLGKNDKLQPNSVICEMISNGELGIYHYRLMSVFHVCSVWMVSPISTFSIMMRAQSETGGMACHKQAF